MWRASFSPLCDHEVSTSRRILLTSSIINTKASAILSRIFAAEISFMESSSEDLSVIAEIFHPDVVIHEPASLPYAGDWKGHKSLGQLFKSMHDVWSSLNVENTRATIDGDTLFMCGTLILVTRKSGKTIRQPFAEVLKIQDDLVIEGTPYYYDTSELCAALG
jgi:ketosteroid isomerase-like protein